MLSSVLSRLRRVARVVLSARHIGVGNAIATARDVYWERLATHLSRLRLILHNRIRLAFPSLATRTLDELRKNRDAFIAGGQSGYRAAIDELGVDKSKLSVLTSQPDVVVGEIDQDGFIRSQLGELDNIPTVSDDEFVPRKRFRLTLISHNGVLAVRKDYRGDRQAFAREVHALDALAQAGCRVPALLDIDCDRTQVVMSYIVGTVLREALAAHGAVLRDRDVERQQFAELAQEELRLTRIREGRNVLAAVVDELFIEDLFQQLRIIHSHRFVWGDIKYGNVVIEKNSGKPYIIDFESASYHPDLGHRPFRRLADCDIEKFNLHFGTAKLTTERLRRRASAIAESEVYAPACFAAGIFIGNLWDNSNGYGRWRFLLKEALPAMEGARVLDLGANNGFNSLQLLRNGAREVVGVELDDKYFDQGEFLRAAFEYTDYRNYNFRYLHANMKDIMTMNLGQFDFAMALCCIYYLDDDEIRMVARYLSTITDTFVLQCNIATGIGRSDPHTYEKASVEYARNVLTDAGFDEIRVIAPPAYHRPLVIGHRLR